MRDFAVPENPADRRRVTRSTVRVLVVAEGRILLLRDSDPGTGDSWWFTPGGGIDPGEGELEAVVRELAEETGLAINTADVLGPLARRRVVHGYSDQIVEQHDTFYAVTVPPFDIDTSGHTEEEQVTLLGHRWWTVDDLTTARDVVWPANLLDLWNVVEKPDEWGAVLPDADESTVPG